jgi:TIR domain-containing protein
MPARKIPEKFLVAFSFAGEQRDLVQSIAEALEVKLGTGTIFFDEWFEYYIAGDDADLKLQEIYSKRAVLVVPCVSERYGNKPWTRAEHKAIRSLQMQLYKLPRENRASFSILPLRVGDGDVPGIFENTICPDVRQKPLAYAVQLIFDRLQYIDPLLAAGTTDLPAEPSWPETPPLDWPMANHSNARDAFATLLTVNARWRFLPIRGPSETGKSQITRQMLAHTLQVSDIACGRFDFKGTIDMDAELRVFVQDLGVPLPPASPRLNERFACIMDALKQRARPTLLIFDTYEAAGEAQDWVEKQLLPSLVRATWLRVVIVGQRVPPVTGAIWAAVSHAPLQLATPAPADWFDYGKRHRPDLKLEDVETACRLASNKSSLLAQLLGPAT